ncbi:hypothetical protein [Pseudactinotalea suaedae]|uniref:hypothetical protein n=1 Tax=Pseudactinotalea suaedae TaxID=1524924 RepID=UPI0012E0FD13|nr:hypothetical protein [Pseudactinotalea suaedae]
MDDETLRRREWDALVRLRSTYESLDRWANRSERIEEPEPGSELATDNDAGLGIPMYQPARHAMLAAVQHLNLARHAVEARQLFPIAHYSVLRGALLGSARAVWLLAPHDQVERQQRTLRAVYDSHRRFRQYVEGSGMDPERVDLGATMFAQLAADAKKRWHPTATLRMDRPPTETEVVAAGAQVTFRDVDQVESVKRLWMQASGDAHGLPWPAMTRPSTKVTQQGWLPGYSRRMITVTSGVDLHEFENSFSLVFRMTRRAWSLFDQRAEHH